MSPAPSSSIRSPAGGDAPAAAGSTTAARALQPKAKKLIIGRTVAEVRDWASKRYMHRSEYWAVAPGSFSYRGAMVEPEDVIWLRPPMSFPNDFLWAIEPCIRWP